MTKCLLVKSKHILEMIQKLDILILLKLDVFILNLSYFQSLHHFMTIIITTKNVCDATRADSTWPDRIRSEHVASKIKFCATYILPTLLWWSVQISCNSCVPLSPSHLAVQLQGENPQQHLYFPYLHKLVQVGN